MIQSSARESYVSPVACKCCPISLMMSLSVRDMSLTAEQGSDAAGWSLPFTCTPAPFIWVTSTSSAADSWSEIARPPADDTGCCIAGWHSRSFLAGGGV